MSWILRSISITETSSLLQFSPSLHYASVSFGIPWIPLKVGRHLAHRNDSFSRSLQEPLQDSCRLNPGWPVTSMRFIRYSLSYQRLKVNSFVNNLMLFETSSNGSLSFSSLTLTWHLYDAFSSSLNTITFDYSTMKWFIYSSRKAYMRGPPSSFIQHWKELSPFHSWHTPDGTARMCALVIINISGLIFCPHWLRILPIAILAGKFNCQKIMRYKILILN
jgi:hypothetical protein